MTHLSGLSNTLEIKSPSQFQHTIISVWYSFYRPPSSGHTWFLIVTKLSLICSSPGASSVHYFQQGHVTQLQPCNWSAEDSFGDVGSYWSSHRLHGRCRGQVTSKGNHNCVCPWFIESLFLLLLACYKFDHLFF